MFSSNKENLSPIALFTYNRPYHTRRTIEALQKNALAKHSDLFIFCDGAKNDEDFIKVNEVRNYLKTIDGFKSVNIEESHTNKGLSNSIINGVTKIVNRLGRIIVLEDDILVSEYFLDYMNEALDLYESTPEVISISGYIYPIKNKNLPETFFIKGADCWGWATWKRGWNLFNSDATFLMSELKKNNLTNEFDFNDSYPYIKMLQNQIDGKVNSWAIRWYASAFLTNKLTLYPKDSLVLNIGFDNSGEHCGATNVYDSKLSNTKPQIGATAIKESQSAKEAIVEFFRITHKPKKPSFFRKFFNHKK